MAVKATASKNISAKVKQNFRDMVFIIFSRYYFNTVHLGVNTFAKSNGYGDDCRIFAMRISRYDCEKDK